MKLPHLKITLFLASLFLVATASSAYATHPIPGNCKQIVSGENCGAGNRIMKDGKCLDDPSVATLAHDCPADKELKCSSTPVTGSAVCDFTGDCPTGYKYNSGTDSCTSCASGYTGYDPDGDPATDNSICEKISTLIYIDDPAVETFKGKKDNGLWEAIKGLWDDDGAGNIYYDGGNVFLEAPFFQDAKLILDNSNIEGVNALQFNDRGSGEGINWGGTSAKIDITEYASGGGSGMWVDVAPGGGGTAGIDGTEGEWLHLKGGFTGISFDAPLTYVSGNVGIGTTNPLASSKLHVITSYQSYDAKAIFGETNWGYGVQGDSNTSAGVVGVSGTGQTPFGYAIDDKIGVYADGQDFGIYSKSAVNYFSGKVGIGTTSPGAKLEVATPVSGTVIKVGRVSGNPSIEASGDAAGDWLIADGGNGIGNVGLNYYSSGDVILANGGGKVGIGTTSPAEMLHVAGDIRLNAGGDIAFGDDNKRIYESSGDLNIDASDDIWIRANGDDIWLIADDDVHFSVGAGSTADVTVNSSGNLGVGTSAAGSALQILRSGGATNAGLWISNWSNNSGSDYDPYIVLDKQLGHLAKMRLNASGTLVFEASDDLFTWPPTAYISTSGVIKAYGSFTTSDERLKKNIEPISGALEDIMKLRGVSYQWKDEHRDELTHLGLIAQEVLPIRPELVIGGEYFGEDEYLNLDYNGLIPLLIESVKELKTENDSLKKRLEALELK